MSTLALATRGLALAPRAAIGALALAAAASGLVAVGVGAVGIDPLTQLRLTGSALGLPIATTWDPVQEVVFGTLRAPRAALALLVGAALSAAGALTQGLFRNPLADPGLIGVTSGASLFAAGALVLGASGLGGWLGPLAVAGAAFVGGLLVTSLVATLASIDGRTSVGTLLLAGIAVQAIAGAGLGLLLAVAQDAALRSITFWLLGSLGGASWPAVGLVGAVTAAGLLVAWRLAPTLDVLLLGEDAARHLGVDPKRLTRVIVALVAVMVGASTALCGAIGFLGLVVPHLARGLVGPRHAVLLPASALLGATVLCLADTLSRTVAAPAELPVGLFTTLVGGPFFLGLLLRRRGGLG